ncbi:Ferrochelatase [Anatilimnocola aggregata]|uniref:Ferrochelatase n=1 Tax=Anatilimnocola aggregata TaxID=2528021 RepID=A0A517YCE4_9BACT|nr:ferrochelatase [Anatilimnocola aggregata]QDU27891.1 Ferrochelatase [Anatilimnocola aggregata]
MTYDALLLVSFGGPEGPDDVLPFLENVLRGKNVPRERMLAVAEHYQHFGGVSPINEQNRALLAAMKNDLSQHGVDLPIYWGNRNWHPLLADTLAQMKQDGVQHALAFFTSGFSSYSGCRQYRENIGVAQQTVGEGAPAVDKLRVFFNHPGFIEPMIERVRDAFAQIPEERRSKAVLLFTAHSIPLSMATNCKYETHFAEASRLIAEGVNHPQHRLVYQSRSGPANQPWLEPDVGDVLKELAVTGDVRDVVVVPVGFISDHMEVMFDLDYEAKHLADELGLNLVRAGTVGTHPRFVAMIRELIQERISDAPKLAIGTLGPSHDVCPADCCKYEPRRPMPPAAESRPTAC